MSNKYSSKILHVALILSIVFLGVVTLGTDLSEGQAKSQISAVSPAVIVTVLDVPYATRTDTINDYSKIADIGTIQLQSADSLLELTYNGRIAAGSMGTSTTAAVFELRLDDVASTLGHARATLTVDELRPGGIPVSFTGLFSGYAAGSHTVSVWVRAVGIAYSPTLNPVSPNHEADVIIAKEYTPFGYSYIPLTMK